MYNYQIEKGSPPSSAKHNGISIVTLIVLTHLLIIYAILKRIFNGSFEVVDKILTNKIIDILLMVAIGALAYLFFNDRRIKGLVDKKNYSATITHKLMVFGIIIISFIMVWLSSKMA
jgi:hypothetical protein